VGARAQGSRRRIASRRSLRSLVSELRAVAAGFDGVSRDRQATLLAALREVPLPLNRTLVDLMHVLMFVAAYPASPEIERAAAETLDRLAQHLERQSGRAPRRLENSGLPFTPTLSTYSHDLVVWMLESRHFRLQIDSFWRPDIRLSQALSFTLPSLESDVAALGVDGQRLLRAMVPPVGGRLRFLVAEFERLEDRPALKDYLFDGLHLYLRLLPESRYFSKAFNRIPTTAPYYHTELLRTVDLAATSRRPLPPARVLTPIVRDAVITAARHAMMLLQRETDPTTHLDPASIRVFDLERGVTVAIYGMVPRRQLPLESYVGYTLFKNGYAAAYGGAWVFARHALFGINVFESFRGGESTFFLSQLLRVYRRTFGVDYFEVEPYQYGRGNPEGIRSGAFWFYYRHGFRPLQPKLAALARQEWRRIQADRAHRTPTAVLLRLADDSMALPLAGRVRSGAAAVRAAVTAFIQTRFAGDRVRAEAACRRRFVTLAGSPGRLGADQRRVFSEVSLWAAAESIRGRAALALLRHMIRVKPADLYGYHRLLDRLRR
jgi:hypothetical protein